MMTDAIANLPLTVLVVDDTTANRNLMVAFLERLGHRAVSAADGEEALARFIEHRPDLILMDLMMPRMDGFQATRQLRARQGEAWAPIIIMSALNADADIVAGLDAGADDYLIKPFDSAELKARIRALLRRSAGRAEPLIQLRGVTLDPQSQQVSFEGRNVNLSRKEFILLHELMAQPDRVLTRDRLEQALYGWNEEVDSNTLEVHIHHLRRKLFSGLIRTLRGVGYMIERDA